MPDSFCQTEAGKTVIVNGIDPVLVWDGYSDTLAEAGIDAPTTAPTAYGSAGGSLNGTYIVYVTYIRDDGLESSLSPTSGTFILEHNGSIIYENVPVSPDPRVRARRIYRSLDGNARSIYLDVTLNDNVQQLTLSAKSDEDLFGGLAYPLLNNLNEFQGFNNNPPPDTKPFAAWHQGRCFYAGMAEYAEGSCEVVTGQLTIQGRGTDWRENWSTRFIYIQGADRTYEVASVVRSTQVLTLTDYYTGPSNLFAAYAIRPPPGETNLVYFSKVGEPEAVKPVDSFGVPEESDEITGLMPMFGFLYVLKRNSIYRFTSQNSPSRDGGIFLSTRRGVINQRCCVVVDDSAFMLDERGAYRFTGGQESQDISGNIQDFFRDGSENVINWSASRFFHASHSPGESCIRFFVALAGDYLPRDALCFSYKLNRWWTEGYHRPIGCSHLGYRSRIAGTWGKTGETVFLGSDSNQIFALAQMSPDVVGSPTSVPFSVTSANICTVTVNGGTTADMVGASIVHRSQTVGGFQTRRIISVSGSTITVHPPWLSQPVLDDEVLVGGIPYQMRTQDLRYADSETTTQRNVEVFFNRNPGQKLDVEISNDYFGPQIAAGTIAATANFGVEYQKSRSTQRADMGKKSGYAQINFGGLREGTTDGRRTMALTLSGVGGTKKDAIAQIVIKGATS